MTGNGALIRSIRQEAGHSIRDLAAEAGVNPGYLSRVERGEAIPSVRWLAAVAAVYDIPVDALTLPDDEPSSSEGVAA